MKTNVVVSVFRIESEGYQAMTELRQAPATDVYAVSAAALIRKEDGICKSLDAFDTGMDTKNDAVKGGLIGAMIGILGGPIGMLLGGSYGALVGKSVDAAEAVLGISMLEQIAGKLEDGTVALVALADEESEEALDSRFLKYDAVVARFDAKVVADEVGRAAQMQLEMARQAREELRKEEKEKVREDMEAGLEFVGKSQMMK